MKQGRGWFGTSPNPLLPMAFRVPAPTFGITAPKTLRVDREEVAEARKQDEADEAYRQWWTRGAK